MGAEKNTPVVTVVVVTAGSLLGAFFASNFLCDPRLLGREYSAGALVRNIIVLVVGAILGGLLFSWASKR